MNQPSASFRDAALKIGWANQNIHNLQQFVRHWLDQRPYQVTLEPDFQAGYQAFQVRLTKSIPAEFLLLTGDICGNLRASLDFAWMGLVRLADPNNPERRTLPIANDVNGLVATIKKAPISIIPSLRVRK